MRIYAFSRHENINVSSRHEQCMLSAGMSSLCVQQAGAIYVSSTSIVQMWESGIALYIAAALRKI